MKFKDSALAHKYCDGLTGIEIGGSAHNPFNLNTRNVDYTDSLTTIFKLAEIELCGEALPVDIIGDACNIPLPDHSVDFVISSHVIEHVFDPISAVNEWKRVTRFEGIIYIICPLKEYVPGENRPFTKLTELIDWYKGKIKPENVKMFENQQGIDNDQGLPVEYIHEILANHETGHFTVFDMNLMLEICCYCGLRIIATQPKDDKVGNGFTVVCRT